MSGGYSGAPPAGYTGGPPASLQPGAGGYVSPLFFLFAPHFYNFSILNRVLASSLLTTVTNDIDFADADVR